MRRDAGPDWGSDEAARERLRAELQRWSVPAPPPEIADALKRELRRRRARRRPAVWLSLAAAVALLAVMPLVERHRRGESPAVPRTSPTASPATASSPAARLDTAAPQAAPAPVRASALRRRDAAHEASPPAVVVEPDQARLLAELGRAAWQRTEAADAAVPGTGEAPSLRAEWEEVAGEWPAVQVVVSESGR